MPSRPKVFRSASEKFTFKRNSNHSVSHIINDQNSASLPLDSKIPSMLTTEPGYRSRQSSQSPPRPNTKTIQNVPRDPQMPNGTHGTRSECLRTSVSKDSLNYELPEGLESPIFRSFSFETKVSGPYLSTSPISSPSPTTEFSPTTSHRRNKFYMQGQKDLQTRPLNAIVSAPNSTHALATNISSSSRENTSDSSTSSYNWSLKKRSPDMRIFDLAKERSQLKKDPSHMVPDISSPRITSFRYEHEHKMMGQDDGLITPDQSQPATPKDTSGPSKALPAPRPLLKTFGRWTSRASRPSIQFSDPPSSSPGGQLSPGPEVQFAPDNPGHGFHSQKRRYSSDLTHSMMETAQLAKSRRAMVISSEDSDSPRYSSSPAKESLLKLKRPRVGRLSSSPHSPGDTSESAMNNPAAASTQIRSPLGPHGKHAGKSTQFPASEAERVHTPPDNKTQPGTSNRRTGYFWDFWYPEEATGSTIGLSGLKTPTSTPLNLEYRKPFPQPLQPLAVIPGAMGPEQERDWYKVRLDRIMADDELTAEDADDLDLFEWDVPEHLPGSPLCPLNPKHRSGGKGICVYHGRHRWQVNHPRKDKTWDVDLWR